MRWPFDTKDHSVLLLPAMTARSFFIKVSSKLLSSSDCMNRLFTASCQSFIGVPFKYDKVLFLP